MRFLNQRGFRVLGVSAFLAVVAAASAQNTAGFYAGGGTFSTFDRATGWEFTTSVDIRVTHLGLLDVDGDGLQERHAVGIFEAANPGISLTETILPAGTVADLIDGSRFQDVDDVILTAGTRYYILADNNLQDGYVYGDGVTFHPTITWGGYVDGQSNDIHSNPLFNGGLPGDLGPNFRFAEVPEPATMLAMAAGLGVLARRRRRKA